MTFFGLQIDGLDQAQAQIDAMRGSIDTASGETMLKLAQRVREVAIEEIASHSRSAPGTPPASRTGLLAESIVARLVDKTASEVLATAEYAKHLEFGTRKMAAHAFLHLAIAIVAPEFAVAEQVALYLALDKLKGYAPDAASAVL